MQSLPIDPLLGEISSTLSAQGVLVLEAPPGAGKTTRVPWALQESLGAHAEVLVTEPRRLAARLAARRVADEHGERLGERVGYSVRFEEVAGKNTRVRYVTEGVLVRRLLEDPALGGVAAVVLDEFHERHLDTDLLLALLKRLRAGQRPDLKLAVMSATLDAEPVAEFLSAPRLRSEGRLFPVAIEHATQIDDRPLEKQVTSAVRRLLDEQANGDILVFLPGAAEIRRASETLASLAEERGVLVLPLHGDLPIAEQARAVEPAARRKVVLSTNVAESSLTIDGVSAVVDSGLARVASHSAWSGLATLALAKISRASATQRAGRAGRTREGRVLRLYTRGDFDLRPAYDAPEILRSDLSESLLALRAAGVRSAEELAWLSPPPAAGIAAAEELLRSLGAVEPDGTLTPVGRRLVALPLPPRLARIVAEGERRGVAEEAALVAALIGERDIRAGARASLRERGERRATDASGPSDLLELAERFGEASHARFEAHRLRSFGLDPRSVEAVERGRRQIARRTKNQAPAPESQDEVDRALLASILAGFPDRVARRRRRGEPDLVLANGRTARLSEQSVVHDAALLVAVDAEEQPGRGTIVRSASAVDENDLFELAGSRVEARDELVWVPESERVERASALRYGAIVLDESRGLSPPSPETARVLLAAAREQPTRFLKSERALRLVSRWALLVEYFPKAGLDPSPEAALERALLGAAEQVSSFAELEKLDWLGFATAELSPEQRRLFENEVPEQVRLGGGRQATIHYDPGKTPWIESRLQDFFGAVSGPRILGGRLDLTLHLLAPNQRAVQVTTDLAGFWERHYPAIRRELMRRYPRHAWPEDGRNATPPAPRQR
ncbi:MAG TPA: ATP-dependent helicase HrpB [Polyangiaceae bacterium]